jgi:hypothetical protein
MTHLARRLPVAGVGYVDASSDEDDDAVDAALGSRLGTRRGGDEALRWTREPA